MFLCCLCCWTHTTTSPPQSWLCLDTAGGGALWDVLYPVEVVSGSSQHEESLLTVPVHQGLQRKPAGTQSQPQIQPAGTVCQCVCECMCPTVVTSVLFERTSRTDWSQVWNSLPLWEVEWSLEATFSRASSHYEGPPHHTPYSPLFFQNHDLSESSLYQTGLDISWPVTLKLKFCSVRQFCLLLFSI